MSAFFNYYSKDPDVDLNGIVAQENEALTYVVGKLISDGLFSLFSYEGNTIWSKRYALPEGSCTFLNAVLAENGDFVIFGIESVRNVDTAIVVRVGKDGRFFWAKRYVQNDVTAFLRIIHLTKDEYVFATRLKGKGKQEDFQLIKIDGNGTIVKAVNVVPESDEIATGLIKTEAGCLIFGATNEKKDWNNFFIEFDLNLVIRWSKLVGDKDDQVVRDVLFIQENEFIVTGENGRTQDSFVYRFDPNQSAVSVNVLDLTKGKDGGFKKLGRIKDAAGNPDDFLLLSQTAPNDPTTFTRFNNALTPLWHKEVDLKHKHVFKDMLIHKDGDERVRCCGDVNKKLNDGLLLRTTDLIDICAASEQPRPTPTIVQFAVKDWNPKLGDPQVKAEPFKLIESLDETDKGELCPRTVIDLSGETLVQSPFVYLQGAGSDASDDTPKGYHLRWDFRKVLADKHIAKGSLSGNYGLYAATHTFNKDDDFVKIYRTRFRKNHFSEVDFQTQPTSFNVGGSTREWIYSNILPDAVTGGIPGTITVSFPDPSAYDAQAALTNPASSVTAFLKAYSGEIHVQLNDKPCFRVEWKIGFADSVNTTNAVLRYEVVSLNDVLDDTSVQLRERQVLVEPALSADPTVRCEDIAYLRFDRVNAFPKKIRFYAYIDYLQGTNQAADWEKINDFSLTLNQGKAYTRLEDTGAFQIDGIWPKFNEDNGVTGEFKVNVANYQNRWSDVQGLNYGVERYLNLSQNAANLSATETVAADPIGSLPDNSTMDISFFDIVQVAGIDYHMGRMLGFGHIDARNNAQPQVEFIYLMEYDTLGDLEDGDGARAVKHIYMTPDFSIEDFKYPPKPVLQVPTYGLTIPNGTSNPSLLTDDQGYTPFADIRFVNVNRDPFQFEKDFESFFQNSTPFTLCEETQTVAFGLEYALSGSPWVKPELNHDRVYTDAAGVEETSILPNTANNPVYRHQETEEGVHCYGLYSINWFSRPSEVSDPACTDYTEFPKRNTLIPPMNLAVQLVQSEAPPILTTGQEQLDYAAISGDKTYLRVTFDWNYIHNQAYQFGHKAQFFFNKQEKRIVKGKTVSVTQLSNNRVQVTTEAYDILSTSPIQTVQPNIPHGLESHFIGSLFSIGGLNYRVESVLDTTATSGNNPTFILYQIRETNSVETPTGSNVWLTTETYLSPATGVTFLVAENMGQASNWDNKLSKSVYLESFSGNDELTVIGSTNNNGKFKILSASLLGADTEIEVDKAVDDSLVDGSVEYNKILRVIGFNGTNNGFLVAGDVTADFTGLSDLKIFGSLDNDADYTISSVAFNGTDTDVIVNESIYTNSWVGCIGLRKQVPVLAYDTANSWIILAGDLTSEVTPSYKELRQNLDGTTTELVMGGLVAACTIVEELDVYDPDNVVFGSNPGDPIPGSRTGIYTMTFAGNPLPPHIDPQVAWFQGKVRVLEDDTYLPTPLDSRTDARMKELNVQNVYEDSGNLVLIAVDPTFQVDPAGIPTSYTPSGEYVPIVTGAGIDVNYHPSYLLYLTVDETPIATGTESNAFNEFSILPGFGEGSRRTFLGIRALDGFNNDPLVDDCASHVATPAAIVAQEIRNPEPPLPPAGPAYATRPDFYGKATYTMDIAFTNIPYSVLVYKANERKILDTLYTPIKVQEILDEMALIPAPDSYFTTRWSEFVNVLLEPVGDPFEGQFRAYPGSTFRFHIPNNPDYILPQSFASATQIFPFNGTDAPGSAVSFTIAETNEVISMEKAVRDAIAGAFNSQTENPMIYEFIVPGEQTRTGKPVLRNENDDLLAPGAAGYNATPYAVKLGSGAIRFTDFNIDGGSNSFYFYYAMEFSDRQIKSGPSGIVGPIQLINTRPAKQPSIKKVITQIENQAESIPTAVCFELEEYIASEGIVRIDLYRAIDPIDALTVRTMDALPTIDITGTIGTTPICDLFENLDYPLYGEDLHYRAVAMRKITLEDGVTEEYIPSEPSKTVRATLVDPNNPPAPDITVSIGNITIEGLENVELAWSQVAYNATYTLQKADTNGNWVDIYQVKSNEPINQYPPLVVGVPDFINYPETVSLDRTDDDGSLIVHRFRVQVENSSGLFNLVDNPLLIGIGVEELLALGSAVSYSDGEGFTQAEFNSEKVNAGSNHPTSMTFTDIIGASLPNGHTALIEIQITVTDDLSNSFTQSITTTGGSVTFNQGDGGLELDTANPNRKYSVETIVITDRCVGGALQTELLEYVAGPCYDLLELTDLLSFVDGNASYSTLYPYTTVDDGYPFPGSIVFTDTSNLSMLPTSQVFTSMDIELRDGSGNTYTQTITSVGGTVTFNDGDGGLLLSANDPNQQFKVYVTLFTDLCATGTVFNHSIDYISDALQDIIDLASIVRFTDGNTNTINPLLSTTTIGTGTNYPTSISIQDLVGALLPPIHTFGNIEVYVSDGLGNSHTLTIGAIGGTVVFNNGDGGLDLGASNPNALFEIVVTVYTDIVPNGAQFAYYVQYDV